MKPLFLNNLLDDVCYTRDELRRKFVDRPQVKEIYVNVKKVSKHEWTKTKY